jgi:hypothetical protein
LGRLGAQKRIGRLAISILHFKSNKLPSYLGILADFIYYRNEEIIQYHQLSQQQHKPFRQHPRPKQAPCKQSAKLSKLHYKYQIRQGTTLPSKVQ